MTTIDFKKFVSGNYERRGTDLKTLYNVSLIPIGFWATMPEPLKVAYIGLSTLGVVTITGAITSNILAKGDDTQQQWSVAIDTFMKITVMVGGALMILWFIKVNPLWFWL